MRRFVLVRHATAKSSEPEARLSASGRREVEALARRLAGWSFDAAWSSDLPRAVETAEAILAGRGSPSLQQTEALREVESPPQTDRAATDPSWYAAWERETTAGLAARLGEWLRGGGPNPPAPFPTGEGGDATGSLLPAPGRGVGGLGLHSPTLLVVSHAGPLRVLICLLLGLPPAAHWCFHLDLAGITVIDRAEDLGTILLLNDRCHLGPDWGLTDP